MSVKRKRGLAVFRGKACVRALVTRVMSRRFIVGRRDVCGPPAQGRPWEAAMVRAAGDAFSGRDRSPRGKRASLRPARARQIVVVTPNTEEAVRQRPISSPGRQSRAISWGKRRLMNSAGNFGSSRLNFHARPIYTAIVRLIRHFGESKGRLARPGHLKGGRRSVPEVTSLGDAFSRG